MSTRRPTSAQLEAFGIPGRFRTAAFLARPHDVGASTRYVEVLTAVHLHHARNQWVVQHVFEAGRAPVTRVLAFTETAEDAALASVDAGRPFGGTPLPDGTR